MIQAGTVHSSDSLHHAVGGTDALTHPLTYGILFLLRYDTIRKHSLDQCGTGEG